MLNTASGYAILRALAFVPKARLQQARVAERTCFSLGPLRVCASLLSLCALRRSTLISVLSLSPLPLLRNSHEALWAQASRRV